MFHIWSGFSCWGNIPHLPLDECISWWLRQLNLLNEENSCLNIHFSFAKLKYLLFCNGGITKTQCVVFKLIWTIWHLISRYIFTEHELSWFFSIRACIAIFNWFRIFLGRRWQFHLIIEYISLASDAMWTKKRLCDPQRLFLTKR